jgi:hypothetical protein
MASATDTRLQTLPGELRDTAGGPWIVIDIPKAVLVLTRRQFIDALRAGKRWRRREAFAARTAKAEEDRCRR